MFNNLFKRKKTDNGNMAVIRKRIGRNQQRVYEAVAALKVPCTGKMVSVYLGWDSACVTNRLSELNKKGRIKIAYDKRGLDRIMRHYYVVNEGYKSE